MVHLTLNLFEIQNCVKMSFILLLNLGSLLYVATDETRETCFTLHTAQIPLNLMRANLFIYLFLLVGG